MIKRPQVGVGVIVIKNKKILLAQRKNSHGHGCWSIPGGHLEFGESLEACAKREVLEETGIEINEVFQGPTTNDIFAHENKHYISIFMIAPITAGDPKVLEPEKSDEWEWFFFDELPKPLFLPFQNLLNRGFNIEKISFNTTIASIQPNGRRRDFV